MQLDAWLCDLKDMRIGDGLHVFGPSRRAAACAATADRRRGAAKRATADGGSARACSTPAPRRTRSARLLAALDGRFVAPGPAGAPSRGRLDVLPTGRNLFAVDPRAVPTRTAWEIGRRTAEEVVARYAQDHGEWPRRIVLDLWGSASDAHRAATISRRPSRCWAFAPVWDHASNRVSGFEILPIATLGRASVDVTLRVSGLFRDVFPDPDRCCSSDAGCRGARRKP